MSFVQSQLALASAIPANFTEFTAAVAAAIPAPQSLTDALEFLALVEGGRRDRIR
jgi:hypothetical protein